MRRSWLWRLAFCLTKLRCFQSSLFRKQGCIRRRGCVNKRRIVLQWRTHGSVRGRFWFNQADFRANDSPSVISRIFATNVTRCKIWWCHEKNRMTWVSDAGLYLVFRTYYRWTELNWTNLPAGLKVGQLYKVKTVLELEWESTLIWLYRITCCE